MQDVQGAVKTLRIIHAAFVATIPVYAAVGELLAPKHDGGPGILRYVFFFLAIANLGVAFYFQQLRVNPAEEILRSDPTSEALAQWQGGHIICFALCEAVALFGLVMRILGGSLADAGPLYLLAFAFLVVWRPQVDFLNT